MNFMSKIGRITDEAFPSRVPVGLPTNRIPLQAFIMPRRIVTGSYFESQGSGAISTIGLEQEMFMIARTHLLMVAWHCSVRLVHRWVSTYPLRWNGKRMTGEEEY